MKNSSIMLDSDGFIGELKDSLSHLSTITGYNWLTHITLDKHNIYVALSLGRWEYERDLPSGYDYYIISFHYEQINLKWIKKQAKIIGDGILLIFHDGNFYNYKLNNVIFITYYTWHYQINKAMKWFPPTIYEKNISKKVSAFCNRISESKLLIFTAIAEYMGIDQNIISLHDWLENKNIYQDHEIVPESIANLTTIFFNKYYGNIYKVDNFDNAIHNYNKYTINPNIPALQECAIHFTNESFHYSDISDKLGDYQHPGPYITEKTFKCLLGQTAFVPVGQFDTYSTLEKLGFEFNYNFDISFDSIIGDHERLEAIINLIKQFANMSKEELFEGTRESSIYNYNHIVNGDFYDICEDINKKSIEKILNIIE